MMQQKLEEERRLQEKQGQLEKSLQRYKQMEQHLISSPQNQQLQQFHEEAEIEAAGYQAEVAVHAQYLTELENALRLQQQQVGSNSPPFGGGGSPPPPRSPQPHGGGGGGLGSVPV